MQNTKQCVRGSEYMIQASEIINLIRTPRGQGFNSSTGPDFFHYINSVNVMNSYTLCSGGQLGN